MLLGIDTPSFKFERKNLILIAIGINSAIPRHCEARPLKVLFAYQEYEPLVDFGTKRRAMSRSVRASVQGRSISLSSSDTFSPSNS